MSTYDATDAAAFIQAFDAGKLTFAELVERFRQTVLPLPPPDAAQQPEYARQSFDHIVSGTRCSPRIGWVRARLGVVP